ncbi:MAG: CapA family protein [Deltaproteobacteria bacterium]|jgi:poly-gamma-glutamate synthesis protein (capsule biosynthesis protein)|nr:CapA family protein [Deltaproteobacteria bacterium]
MFFRVPKSSEPPSEAGKEVRPSFGTAWLLVFWLILGFGLGPSPSGFAQTEQESSPVSDSGQKIFFIPAESGPKAKITLPARPRQLAGRKCSVRLMAVGDILMHTSLRQAAAVKEGGFDFSSYFRDVAALFARADLVIGNLETPLAGAGRGYGGYPQFNVPEELAANLKSVGFTTVTLTNNHALDRGWEGLAATIENVRAAGLDYVGAYTGPDDKAGRLVRVYNGVKIGFLAYSYGFNGPKGPPKEEDWRLGFIDNDVVMEDMAAARIQGADFVIVSLHFGNEYQRLPSPRQKKLVEKILQGDPEKDLKGADLVLGHHPHVVQPYILKQSPDQSQLAVYSLGNFISNQMRSYTNLGVILECQLNVGPDGRQSITDIRLRPTLCYTRIFEGRRIFRVIPLDAATEKPEDFSFLDKESLKKISRQKEEMDKHLAALLEMPEAR